MSRSSNNIMQAWIHKKNKGGRRISYVTTVYNCSSAASRCRAVNILQTETLIAWAVDSAAAGMMPSAGGSISYHA